jgi:hypothetical protein
MTGTRLTDREQWELLIPEMGYMALLRNLRNFDNSGIKDSLANKIAQKISDPDEVAKSKQLPFRFYSAWMNTQTGKWKNALAKGLDHSLQNIPKLDGSTEVLVDVSGSMHMALSDNRYRGPGRKTRNINTLREEDLPSQVPTRAGAAALFGVALAVRNPGSVDLWGFADKQALATGLSGVSTLTAMERFLNGAARQCGGGTMIEKAVRDTYNGQDRVIVLTDEQSMPTDNPGYYQQDVTQFIPDGKHVYGFNLAGYENSAIDYTDPYKHCLGGLTDHTFGAIPLIEAGVGQTWPWE